MRSLQCFVVSGFSLFLPVMSVAQTVAHTTLQTAWTTFQEPSEKAYSIEVPKGWKSEGGTGRRSPSAVMPWLKTTSPDGSTTIFIGDQTLPHYRFPSKFEKEGQVINGPAGTVEIMTYKTGQEFAAMYGPKLLPANAQNVKLDGSQDEPHLVKGAPVPNVTVSAGSADFTFDENGVRRKAYIVCHTILNQGPGMMIASWSPVEVHGFFTKPGSDKAARAEVEHMSTTFKVDPQWLAALKQASEDEARRFTAQMQQNNQQFMNWSRMQNQQFMNQSRASFQASQQRLQAIGDRSRAQAQYNAQWHANQMVQHYGQMAAKDNNNYHEVLMIQNKHLEWNPVLQRNVEVSN